MRKPRDPSPRLLGLACGALLPYFLTSLRTTAAVTSLRTRQYHNNIEYKFNVLVNAILLFFGIRDNFSLLKVIQPIFQLNYLVSSLNNIIFNRRNNLFVFLKNYLATIYKLIARAFSSFILDLINNIKQGRRLETI